ncbi:MAG TPA: hypothetical protein DCL66_08625 [Gammaproteobacteria bacterium]|nr:hypothetical protein [Gammaproteobacteria bacterium]
MNSSTTSDLKKNLDAGSQRSRLFKFCSSISKLSEASAAILLIAVVGMNLVQIFFRYVIVDPLSWTEEGMRYSAIWMTFLALAPALVRGEHMAIDLFQGVPSIKLRRFVGYLAPIAIGGFCILLIWKGLDAAIGNLKQVSPAIRITMIIPYAAVPLGAGLTLIQVVCTLLSWDTAIQSDVPEGDFQ